MNPEDFKRTIYSESEYKINKKVIEEKLANAKKIYSQQLVRVVKMMIEENYQERMTME